MICKNADPAVIMAAGSLIYRLLIFLFYRNPNSYPEFGSHSVPILFSSCWIDSGMVPSPSKIAQVAADPSSAAFVYSPGTI